MKAVDRWRRARGLGVRSYYQRFESGVALVLTLLISLIILVALEFNTRCNTS